MNCRPQREDRKVSSFRNHRITSYNVCYTKLLRSAAISRFANCGQVCICNEMVMVDEKVADEFTEKLIKRVKQVKVGDPFDAATNMGPSVSTLGIERVDQLVKETRNNFV